MSDTVIKVENISKFYQLGLINHGTLAKDLQGWWAKIRGKEDPNSRVSMLSSAKNNSDNDFIYALKDVSFDVKQGEVLGIIGANGAGKSTLLKILSRVTSPTSGCIKIKGRIGSLLEVGTGFHPELTGRENIYLNGAILGMRKHEIDRKFDEILDFSGVEKFIDTPVKRYSSGMYVRLAFAVAAHLDPEILVIDEVLAVGDAEFQKKALGKMQDVSRGEGRTVLFVSHNMASIRQLCRNGILLQNGSITFVGDINSTIDFYLKNYKIQKPESTVIVTDAQHDFNRSLYVKFLSFSYTRKNPIYASDEDIEMEILIEANKSKECRINCTIFNAEGTPIGSNTSMNTFMIEAGNKKLLRYIICNPRLAKGYYTISFSIGCGDASSGETNYDVVDKIIGFEVDKIKADSDLYYAKWNNGWGNIFFETKTFEK
jgi:lipopolysaccharide transport system ATP-binding protein